MQRPLNPSTENSVSGYYRSTSVSDVCYYYPRPATKDVRVTNRSEQTVEDVQIRRVKTSEHEATTRVWMRSWESTGLGHSDDLTFGELCEKFEYELAHGWDLFVAVIDTRIAGMLALRVGEQQLDQLFVDPNFQGSGIGLKLLNFAKQRLPDGMWLRTAEENTRAIRFYEAAGFIFVRKQERPEWDRYDSYFAWTPGAAR